MMMGVAGERRQDFAEIGRTEIIQDNLNPAFQTRIEFSSGTPDQVMIFAGSMCILKRIVM